VISSEPRRFFETLNQEQDVSKSLSFSAQKNTSTIGINTDLMELTVEDTDDSVEDDIVRL